MSNQGHSVKTARAQAGALCTCGCFLLLCVVVPFMLSGVIIGFVSTSRFGPHMQRTWFQLTDVWAVCHVGLFVAIFLLRGTRSEHRASGRIREFVRRASTVLIVACVVGYVCVVIAALVVAMWMT
jgi:uncharacterized protein YacL